jgi:uncharacterized repeat protein (TIGR03803 family)
MATRGKPFLAFLIFTAHAGAQTFSTLYTFAGDDDAWPNAVVIGNGGVLYGTSYGGSTVFSLTPPALPGGPWTEAILSNLTSTEGVRPLDGVAIGAGGVLYATAFVGGSPDGGTVFSSTPPAGTPPEAGGSWTVDLLHAFKRGSGGGLNPGTSVVIGAGGVLYGTAGGGIFKNGVVFSLTPPVSPRGAWTETILHSFKGGSDGASPNALAIDGNGRLYGTTYSGGTSNFGTVFCLTPPAGGPGPGFQWVKKILHNFAGPPADGANPTAGVTIGGGGALYGSTVAGGAYSTCPPSLCGTVFSLIPPAAPGSEWTEYVLYSFPGPGGVETDLVIGRGGVLYGATCCGGAVGAGSVFSLTPPAGESSGSAGSWTFAVLHEFDGANDGFLPQGVVVANDGVLYGATNGGGASNNGTIFAIKP